MQYTIKLRLQRESGTTQSGFERFTPISVKAANEVDAVDQFVLAFNKCWFARRSLTARGLTDLVDQLRAALDSNITGGIEVRKV